MTIDKPVKIEKIVEGIYSVETYYLDREKFAGCYLVESGGEAAVIETNTNYAVPMILGGLEQIGIKKEQVKYVILTHIHLDHAGGAGELMEHLPNATLAVHPRGRKHMINPEKLIESVKQVYGEDQYKALYGEIKPIPEDRVQTVEEGSTLYVGSRELQFFDMRGHAKHHVCIFDTASRSVFSGDNFGIGYPRMNFEKRVIFPSTSPTQFEPDQALETYSRIMALKPDRVLLTHFGSVEDVEAIGLELKEWVDFSVHKAGQRWQEGLRDDALTAKLQEDLWGRFENKVTEARGAGLSDEEKVWLAMDTDLNAQGLAYYVRKLDAR